VELILIGYWRSENSPEWPDPHDFVDSSWDETERHLTVNLLRAGTIARTYRGWSYCRFCAAQNGDNEFTDGTYLWPGGLAHYVESHGVRLPEAFVRHAIGTIDRLESAPVDRDWWKSQA